jgi:malate dehydrogenase (oxaloacetate-decarboxylating)
MNLARKINSKEGFFKNAKEMIETNRKLYMKLMDEKLIKELPGGMEIEK